MSVNYVTAVKNTRMTAVRDAIDAGAGSGKLKIYTAGYALLLVEIALSDPCGTVSNGILTFSGLPKSGVAGNTGVAAIARLTDSTDTLVADGLTVGLSATDIIIDNTNIANGQTVNFNSGIITHG